MIQPPQQDTTPSIPKPQTPATPQMQPPKTAATSPTPTSPTAIPGLAPMTPPAQPTVTPVPQTPPQISGAMQSFGPGNDLRTTQINPTADPRLTATQGRVDQAADKLSSGPDRFQLAQDRFKTYADQTDPAFQASIRDATQKAAANGAIGSGMLGTTYGNLGLQRSRDLQAERDTLFNNALEGTIGDNQTNTGILAGLEGQQFGEGVQGRGELRGERGYQNAMEQQAYDRGVQGLTLEDALTNSAFGRGLAQENVGLQNNPAQMQMLLSGLYGQQASDAGNALSSLMQSSATNDAVKGAYGQPVLAPTEPSTDVVSRPGDVLGGSLGSPSILDVLNTYGQAKSPIPSPAPGAPY